MKPELLHKGGSNAPPENPAKNSTGCIFYLKCLEPEVVQVFSDFGIFACS
jgi:hypothetical protein